jgi:hypothetical protein
MNKIGVELRVEHNGAEGIWVWEAVLIGDQGDSQRDAFKQKLS